MWTTLNEEGKKVWGDVFPDGKVPVIGFFNKAHLQGQSQEQVVLINWHLLSEAQQCAILVKIAQKSHSTEADILKDILKVGLPLRERYTTGTVAAELRFFI